jgi:hypothetical protein
MAARTATVLPAPTSPQTTPRAASAMQKPMRATASAWAVRPSRLRRIDEKPVTWQPVLGIAQRPPGGSWLNKEEAQHVAKLVRRLLERLPPEATIGVVTPFRPQQELISEMCKGLNTRVGTVHVGDLEFWRGRPGVLGTLADVADADNGVPSYARRRARQTADIQRQTCCIAGSRRHGHPWSSSATPSETAIRAASSSTRPRSP